MSTGMVAALAGIAIFVSGIIGYLVGVHTAVVFFENGGVLK